MRIELNDEAARLRRKAKSKIKQGRKSKEKASKKKQAMEEEATTVELLGEMVALVTSWATERSFQLVADGAYATLAGSAPENVSFVGRIRKDAAIYALPVSKKTTGRGRPPKKGKRLPAPEPMARRAKKKQWKRETFMLYGETVERLLYSFKALWYHVCPDQLVRIVCVRDEKGKQTDEFFFTTDLSLSPVEIVQLYGSRWSIEITFREAKQHLGLETPQARLQKAVERQSPFCLLTFSLIALWYLIHGHKHPASKHQNDPWYPHKEGVSFATMLSTLRVASWQDRIFDNSTFHPQQRKIVKLFLRAFSRPA